MVVMPLQLRVCRDALAALALFYLVKIFLPFDVSTVTFGLGILILITAYAQLTPVFRRAVALFTGLALFLLLSERMPLPVWMDGVHSLISIVAILVVMRLFSIPILLGNYKEALEWILLTQFRTERKIFAFVGILTHILASFLLNGSIPLIHSLFGGMIKDNIKDYKRFEGAAVVSGYSLIVLWAPSCATILVAMRATGASWGQLALPGIILTVLGMILSNVIEAHWLSGKEMTVKAGSEQTVSMSQAYGKAAHIGIVVASMLLSNIFLERVRFASSLERVLLTGTVISGIWIWIYGRHMDLRREMRKYWDKGILTAGDMAGLFIAIGLFAESFAASRWMTYIAMALSWFFDRLGVFAPCVIPLVIMLFSMIGVHPLIAMILIGSIVSSVAGMVTPTVLGLALVIGCVLSYLMSPFVGITLILSGLIQCSPLEISFKSNRGFFAAFYTLSFIFLLIMQRWV
jgi:hypothetical protein